MRRFFASVVFALPLLDVAACLSFGDLQGSSGQDAAIDTTSPDTIPIVDTSTIDAYLSVDTGPLIGADFYNSYWTGGIDDVRLFSRALTDAEIKTLASQ